MSTVFFKIFMMNMHCFYNDQNTFDKEEKVNLEE